MKDNYEEILSGNIYDEYIDFAKEIKNFYFEEIDLFPFVKIKHLLAEEYNTSRPNRKTKINNTKPNKWKFFRRYQYVHKKTP